MTVRFNPPQLQVARHSPTLLRVLDELSPPHLDGELRVLQNFPQEPMRLVLIVQGKQPSSISVPRAWLYSDLTEPQIRECVQTLLTSVSRRRRAA